jgi:hypothetical protein
MRKQWTRVREFKIGRKKDGGTVADRDKSATGDSSTDGDSSSHVSRKKKKRRIDDTSKPKGAKKGRRAREALDDKELRKLADKGALHEEYKKLQAHHKAIESHKIQKSLKHTDEDKSLDGINDFRQLYGSSAEDVRRELARDPPAKRLLFAMSVLEYVGMRLYETTRDMYFDRDVHTVESQGTYAWRVGREVRKFVQAFAARHKDAADPSAKQELALDRLTAVVKVMVDNWYGPILTMYGLVADSIGVKGTSVESLGEAAGITHAQTIASLRKKAVSFVPSL